MVALAVVFLAIRAAVGLAVALVAALVSGVRRHWRGAVWTAAAGFLAWFAWFVLANRFASSPHRSAESSRARGPQPARPPSGAGQGAPDLSHPAHWGPVLAVLVAAAVTAWVLLAVLRQGSKGGRS
jgi:hypothetical protein